MLKLVSAVVLVFVCVATSASADVVFEWATVGNAGNAGEMQTDGNTYGAVSNTYRISKHEVTNAQYTEFLNAVDSTGSNSLCLFNSSMADNFGGIANTGPAGSPYVAQAGREQNPVTYVSWYDAARFSNWLHNGQGSGSTETGAYTLLGGGCTPTNGSSITRNTGATHFLPSENEWYKAAYHDASAGMAGTYFDYPTGTDTQPHTDNPGSLNTPENSNVVNMFRDDGAANGYDDGYAVSGSTSFSLSTNPFTDVGAYTASDSPYGTFDQGGNVWEWNETLVNSSSRGLRGGGWSNSPAINAAASNRVENGGPAFDFDYVGFRVASVPEPSSLLYLGLVLLGVGTWKKLTS